MLIITRRIGEEILMDKGQIEIKVLYVRKGHIGIGIKAHKRIDIERKEYYLKRQSSKELEKAAESSR